MTSTKRVIALTTIAIVGLSLTTGAAHAASLSYSYTVPTDETNFDAAFTLSKYNLSPALTGVTITLDGLVTGDASAENLSGKSPTTAVLNLRAKITLSETTTNTFLAQVLPLVKKTVTLPKFDGKQDFAGRSGVVYSGLTASDSTTQSYGPLALFIGPGNLNLNIGAVGSSFATGGGNFISFFNTNAGATATITYEYVPDIPKSNPEPIPESQPITILGVGTALGFRAAFRFVKKNSKTKLNSSS